MKSLMKHCDDCRVRSWLATLWLFACVSGGLLLAGPAAMRHIAPAARAAAGGQRTVHIDDVRTGGDYRTVNIEDVRAGDTVWAYDTAADAWRPGRVIRPQTHDYEGDVVTIAAAGQAIESTGNHPFWVARGEDLADRPPAEDVPTIERETQADGRWVEARHLQLGDLLLLRNGELATVEELASRRERVKVYNLEVAGLHTYAVGAAGVLVHNKAAPAKGPMPSGPPPGGPRPGRGPGPTVDARTGDEVGAFVGDGSGNLMIAPRGAAGSGGSSPRWAHPGGKGGKDTHTRYPNGSNYHRYNPNGHPNNPTPHAHGHAQGKGPNMSGQGDSLDPSGNVVPSNSPDAHWPIHDPT